MDQRKGLSVNLSKYAKLISLYGMSVTLTCNDVGCTLIDTKTFEPFLHLVMGTKCKTVLGM